MEEYSIFVPHVPNTFAYPYIARIVGEDPVYRFKRVFLRFDWPDSSPNGRWYYIDLEDGVYECCIRRFDAHTKEVIEREFEWFILFDGGYFDVDKADIPLALFNLEHQYFPSQKACTNPQADFECPHNISPS